MCQLRMSMAAVCGALLYRNVKHVQFDDLMSTAERQAALAAFHDDVPFLVMSARTNGIGLNLQIASTVIIFESDFNSQTDIQALNLVTRCAATRRHFCIYCRTGVQI